DEKNPSEENETDIDPPTITPEESLESPSENTPDQADEEQGGSEQAIPSKDQQSSPSLSSALKYLNITQLHPDQALLDQVTGKSSSESSALSDSY
ncbi:hypothetical protein K7432_015585, partial [Basidiobolus ranarum]